MLSCSFCVVISEFLLKGKKDLLYAVLISRNVIGSLPSVNRLSSHLLLSSQPPVNKRKKEKYFIKENKPKAVQLLV